jgi:hypothetical protein
MYAKDRGVNTGDPAQCNGTGPSNRRSARIGAGLSRESERSTIVMKRVMIVERRNLSSRATREKFALGPYVAGTDYRGFFAIWKAKFANVLSIAQRARDVFPRNAGDASISDLLARVF